MAVQKLGKLDPDTVAGAMREIQAEPLRRAETIAGLLRLGARGFIEQSFELDDRQRREFTVLENKDADDVLQRALLLALAHDGSIKVRHEGHQTPNLDVELSVGIDDEGHIHVDLTVSC